MNKFPIVAAGVLFAMGIPVILTWYPLVDLPRVIYQSPNFSPIKGDPYLTLISHLVILLIFIALAFGIYLHQRKNPLGLRIISFFFAVVLIDNIYSILSYLQLLLIPRKPLAESLRMLEMNEPVLQDYLPMMIACLAYVIVAAICLKMISSYLKPRSTVGSAQLKWLRLGNWVADVLIISQILFSKLPLWWIQYISEDELVLMTVIAITHTLVYYSFFESVFRRTPGKYLTNTAVSTVTDEAPPLSTILLRSILRVIPFDFVSFLFAGNWHDRLSKTKVT